VLCWTSRRAAYFVVPAMPPSLQFQLPSRAKADCHLPSPRLNQGTNVVEKHFTSADTTITMPMRIRSRLYESDTLTSKSSRPDSPRIDKPGRSPRPRSPTTTPPLPVKTAQSGPPLPSPLKAFILVKRAEWLEANKLERAEVSDPIEKELETLERQALAINATVFRRWRERMYRDAK
jgi:hypothetical protein